MYIFFQSGSGIGQSASKQAVKRDASGCITSPRQAHQSVVQYIPQHNLSSRKVHSLTTD